LKYRLYRLDGAGKITTGEWIEAADDAQAMGFARASEGAGKFELWERNRFVGRVSKEAL
jgi:hypothetical protein